MNKREIKTLQKVRGILNNHVHGNRTRPDDINEAFHEVNRLLLPYEQEYVSPGSGGRSLAASSEPAGKL